MKARRPVIHVSLPLRSSLRVWSRHPIQLTLLVLGIALGVAVAFAVDLSNASAMRAFEYSTEALSGRTTHQIRAAGGVAEDFYRRLRLEHGIRSMAPIVEGFATVRPDTTSEAGVRLLGVDPIVDGALRSFAAARPGSARAPQLALLVERGAVLASQATVTRLGLQIGVPFEVRAAGRIQQLVVIAFIDPTGDGAEGLDDVLIADIATAQEVLDRIGLLSRIDLRLTPEGVEPVRGLLPNGAVLATAAALSDANVQMTRAFRLNLQAMSLLAILCGMFLIYNTASFSIVQRRELVGTLRAVGVTRAEITRLLVWETFVIACLGTGLGLLAGWALALGLVRLVTRTINDLYFVVSVRQLSVAPWNVAAVACVGVIATLLATWPAIREASRTLPRVSMLRSTIESSARRTAVVGACVGAAVLASGALLIGVPSTSLALAFLGMFALVAGAALIVPLATLAASVALRQILRPWFGALAAMAANGIATALSRTAVAVAALAVAVAVVIGVGTMVNSFRLTLQHWLGYTLQADLYMAPTGLARSPGVVPWNAARAAQFAAIDGVRRVRTLRFVSLPTETGTVQVQSMEFEAEDQDAYRLVEGDWQEFVGFDAVLASEPFAQRNRTRAGDRVEVMTARGRRSFRVAGVYRSYASDRGALLMPAAAFVRFWPERGVNGISVYLDDGASVDAVRTQADRILGTGVVAVTSQRDLLERSLAIFDRTFLITGVLRILVSIIAFAGVLSALLAIQLERRREHGILRASGLTPGQLGGLVAGQCGLIGLIAGVLSLPLGVGLGWVMVHVINKRSFGWSLEFHLDPAMLAQAMALAVGAALLAGVYPALRLARRSPIEALRDE